MKYKARVYGIDFKANTKMEVHQLVDAYERAFRANQRNVSYLVEDI